jgi:hypothetical protein
VRLLQFTRLTPFENSKFNSIDGLGPAHCNSVVHGFKQTRGPACQPHTVCLCIRLRTPRATEPLPPNHVAGHDRSGRGVASMPSQRLAAYKMPELASPYPISPFLSPKVEPFRCHCPPPMSRHYSPPPDDSVLPEDPHELTLLLP